MRSDLPRLPRHEVQSAAGAVADGAAVAADVRSHGSNDRPSSDSPSTAPRSTRTSASDADIGWDVRTVLKQRVIAMLDADDGSYAARWIRSAGQGVPRNAHTGRPYRGINIVLLWEAAALQGYPTNWWLTYPQAARVGAQVRRGERGVLCGFVEQARYAKERGGQGHGAPARRGEAPTDGAGDRDPRQGSSPSFGWKSAQDTALDNFACRPFWLFNAAQIDGLPQGCEALADARSASSSVGIDGINEIGCAADGVEKALRIIGGCDVTLRHAWLPGLDRAAYLPAVDEIHLPMPDHFANAASYCAAVLRTLVLWSGHSTRLARRGAGSSATAERVFEGLVADLGAAFLVAHCALMGASTEGDGERPDARERRAALIGLLQRDGTVIFQAAQRAQDAVDFVVARAMPEMKRLVR